MIETLEVKAPAIGQLVGKCLLLERIGQGGTGQVFLARHQSLHIMVAVKLLLGPAGDNFQRRLIREARLLARINHPNIVRVWDYEDDAEWPHLVLEYVDGINLAQQIRYDGQMPPAAALEVIAQIAAGLAAAQRIGIVHRDVKPGNILLSHDGTAKLADLGLALNVEPRVWRSAKRSLAGTVAYLAPEQARVDEEVDHRSDIYSLGATFYHMVTGRAPFQASTRLDVVQKHLWEEPVPPHELTPKCDPSVSSVILKMLAKEPNYRYQTYEELRDALFELEAILASDSEKIEDRS